jgi:glucose 1-dehydrogenase
MRAMGVVPGEPNSAAVVDVPDPDSSDGQILVRARMVGVCGTDVEIVNDGYGSPPEGATRLVLGHESLGEVVEAPAGVDLAPGDLVVGIVRRPDPEPCACCARGEWDMCRNGRFVERGIVGADGYGAEWWRVDPIYAVRVDPALGDLGVLIEPASVLAKVWEQVERIGARACFEPQTAVVTGAGPTGLLAALMARQRGLATWVLDVVDHGPKPQLVADLGATYSTNAASELPVKPDVVIECTGMGTVLTHVVASAAPNAIIALVGISHQARPVSVDLDAINRQLVLGNQVIFGSVNAARRHYEQAVQALADADSSWLARMLTRSVPLAAWPQALVKAQDDIRVTVKLDDRDP